MRLSCTVTEIRRLKYWTHGPGHKKKDGTMKEKGEGKWERERGKKAKGEGEREGKGKVKGR